MAPTSTAKATRTSARIATRKSGASKAATPKTKKGKAKKASKGPSGPKVSSKSAAVPNDPTADNTLQAIGVHNYMDSSSDEEGPLVPLHRRFFYQVMVHSYTGE